MQLSGTDEGTPTPSLDAPTAVTRGIWPLLAAAPAATLPTISGERELRIDLFRGLSLWLIFIDHVSPDVLAWFTIRSYGFSDAAEIFIFLSGFTAAFVYGRTLFEAGFVIGSARILRRVWQIYCAHILLFSVLIAAVAVVTGLTGNGFYMQETEVTEFFRDPGPAMIQALLLRYRPLNMDVLPLYVVLMSALPLVLLLAKWRADFPLAISIALYTITIRYDLHLSSYPAGFWSFNPFAWQLLFVFGAWCALGGGRRISPLIDSPVVFWIAVGYIVACFLVTLTWYLPSIAGFMPAWLVWLIYPIDKTDLDILRFGHFLALAVVALRFVPNGWRGLESPWAQPLILCGQYSLQIFSLGVALSFIGYAALTETSAGFVAHIAVGVIGILIMCGVALLFTWYRRALSAAARRHKPLPVRSA
ncbi:OpgC domain-containing protein [Bradyrhizobium arachidis]|nr:OpgC domain-containing protein [Bradyrhizobium arachidis]